MIAAIAKNGPKGISWVFFIFSNIKDIGSAINADKKTATMEIGKPNTKPNTANSFISPPPIDSFLNKKSPKIFNNNINTKAPIACIKDIPTKSTPLIKYLININKREKNIKTESGIIIVW